MGEQMMNDEMEIDLLEIAHLLWKKIGVIILCMVVGIVAAGGATHFLITPKYEASSMIYVLGKTTSISSAIDLQLSKQLTVDFTVLATSRPVIEKVIEETNLNMTYEEVLKEEIVSVENPDNSSILKMTATHPDPEVAMRVANALSDATAERIEEVMVTDRPSTVEEAVTPEYPCSPNLVKNALIGGLAGAFLICAYLVIQFLLDDTIKSKEDVAKYLGLDVLAMVPAESGKQGKKAVKAVKGNKAVKKAEYSSSKRG